MFLAWVDQISRCIAACCMHLTNMKIARPSYFVREDAYGVFRKRRWFLVSCFSASWLSSFVIISILHAACSMQAARLRPPPASIYQLFIGSFLLSSFYLKSDEPSIVNRQGRRSLPPTLYCSLDIPLWRVICGSWDTTYNRTTFTLPITK